MMTPKEALIKDGTIPVKAGRGRLSREAVERCKWLVANKGWSIAGYEASNSRTADPAKPVEVKKVKTTNEKVIHDITYTYPEASFKAVDATSNKVLPGKYNGMREVCNTCGVSLVAHICQNPTILGGQRVKIVAK